MKNNALSIILIIISLQLFGQITFEKGYFINNNDQRSECLIRNMDWKKNPKDFKYKLNENSGIETGNLDSVKEFGITGFSRYIRADIKIDLSPMEMVNFSKQRNPEWSQKSLFLKVLVEGKATLYYFEDDGLIRFFYSVPDSSIKQLIYKEYYAGNEKIARNYKFREQLWMDLRCPDTKQSELAQINYRKTDLERYFKKFNDCNGSTSIAYGKKEKRDNFHIGIIPGINYSSVSLSNATLREYNTDFNSRLNFRIGLEAELIMPFNKNKWGILFEPTFQNFNSSKQFDTYTATVHYNYIEFPVGVRYYFFLNQDLKLFVNAMIIPTSSFKFNSIIQIETAYYDKHLKIKSSNGVAFGGGLGFKKMSAQVLYYSNRNILSNYTSWSANYSTLAFILGYRIF